MTKNTLQYRYDRVILALRLFQTIQKSKHLIKFYKFVIIKQIYSRFSFHFVLLSTGFQNVTLVIFRIVTLVTAFFDILTAIKYIFLQS